jgi:hypothetical protein
MISRRTLLAATPAALAGCATLNSPSGLASDVQLVSAGVAAAVQQIAAIPGVASSLVTKIQADALIVSADAAKIAAAAAAASGLVPQIAAAVNEIAALVLPLFPATQPFVPLINGALSLLPVILAAAGVSGATPAAPVYTPDEARLILRGAA